MLDIVPGFNQGYGNTLAYQFVRGHCACRTTPNYNDAAIIGHKLPQYLSLSMLSVIAIVSDFKYGLLPSGGREARTCIQARKNQTQSKSTL
jgi:hypothetical protein